MKDQKGLRIHGSGPRSRAAGILLRLHQSAGDRPRPTVQEVLSAELAGLPDARDAALCTEIVYGTLRQEPRLEWLLGHFLDQPQKLPPAVWMLLLGASYELTALDRIPARATIHETVEIVRKTAPGLVRLVNAVLRSVDRLGPAVHDSAWYAEQIADPLQRLAVEQALPPWIIALWAKIYSPEIVADLAKVSSVTPWPSLRLNPLKPGWQALRDSLQHGGGQPVAFSGLSFAPGTSPESIPQFIREGKASWQGSGTQSILQELRAEAWPGPVWDACAGRGGKTCALLERGLEVRLASDPHPRIRQLPEEAARLGLPLPECREAPMQEVCLSFTPTTILLDVPCSGLGTLARKPDIRLARTSDHLEQLVTLQTQILEKAWESLTAGGLLAYVTCTVNPRENEDQIRRLLQTHPEARCEKECRTSGEHGADIMYGALIRKG